MTPQARLGYYRGRPAKTPVSEDPSELPDLWRKQAAVKEIRRTESVASESAVLVGVFLAERDQSDGPRVGPAGRTGRSGRGRRHARRGQADAAPRSPRRDDLSGQGKGAGTDRPGPRRNGRRDHLRQRSQPRPDPQSGEGHRAEGARPHGVDPRHLRQPGPDARGPPGGRAGPVGIPDAAA